MLKIFVKAVVVVQVQVAVDRERDSGPVCVVWVVGGRVVGRAAYRLRIEWDLMLVAARIIVAGHGERGGRLSIGSVSWMVTGRFSTMMLLTVGL